MRSSLPLNRQRRSGFRLAMIIVVLFAAAFVTRTALVQSDGSQDVPVPLVAEQAKERVGGGIDLESKMAARAARTGTDEADSAAVADPNAVTASNNYVFATATNASFTNMSSGTTQLVAAMQDDTASVLTNIGFDFYLLGTRYTQFSASSNGYVRLGGVVSTTQYTLGTVGQTLITALGSDNFVSTTGKVHYKVTGAAPNRVLTVEFLNETIIYDGAGATADGTYQVRLNESTGVIEFVYGAMARNSSTGFGGGMDPQFIGFSTNSTTGTFATIDTTNTVNTTAPPVSNQFPLSTPMANLNTPVDGSRRTYSFTPATPTAPTALNFTGVTPIAMTVNWTDSPDESLYAIYRSTDGVNYSFVTTAAQNSVSFNATGLNPSTSYFWQVYAISDGAISTALSGTQATTAPGVVTSSAAGGPWSSSATWTGGAIPTNTDDVTIADGATVTIDTAAVALDVTVGQGASGILQWDATTARTLTVGLNLTVAAGGTFTTGLVGNITTHVLSVGGNLTNNGTLDFSNIGFSGVPSAGITFTGATNNTFGGSGGTTDISTLTINKGTSNANILELNPTNFTVQGTAVDGAPMAFLTLTNGTLKVSGTFTLTGRVFTAAGYTIGATTAFWLNNPNFTVAGQNGSPTTNGQLRISQGTFNIGTATGNSMGFATGSNILVEGGAVNATGRFGVTAAGNTITYTQTAGTVTVCTIGNAAATGSFDLGTSLSSVINISGGTIVVQLASTNAAPIDYRNQAGSGFTGVTSGTLQLGNAASGAAKAFNLRGVLPNVVITNTSANHTATMSTTLVNFNNISRNITINTGNTMNFGNVVFLFAGTTLTNNGTLTHNGASSNFVWFLATAPVSYTGSGTVTSPLSNFAMQADQGLTIDPASPAITTLAVRLFSGSIINSNKLTVGNGGVTSSAVQIGNTTTPTAAGTFDTAPTFNPGTAGIIMSYLRTIASRSTGPEVPAARTITTFTYDDNDVTHSLTLAGGDLTVTGTTALTNGHVITGANTQIVGSAGTVTRTTGLVDGNFRKTYTAAGSKVFEVGTANGFSPVTVNATAGTFPADFTAKAVQGPEPAVNPSTSIQRYWTLTGVGITADLTFQYLVGDVIGTEANYKIIRVSGGTAVAFPSSVVTPATHVATLTGVSNFSDWTVGEITSPTAAPAMISGIVTRSDGRPLGGVTVNLSGGHLNGGARTITDGNGQYRFDNVATDGFYVVTPGLVNYSFTPSSRAFALVANKTDAVFTATSVTQTENPLNFGDFFVRQQYLDFLGREPEQTGWLFWSGQISSCGLDQNCIRQKRIDISAAFFMSEEFQRSGNYVYRLYRAGLGRQLTYAEFTDDHKKVIGGPDLESLRSQFADNFVQRSEFIEKYQNTVLAETFVDALLQGMLADAQLDLSTQREALIATYNSAGDLNHSRSAVLRAVAERSEFKTAVYNPSFVLMEYFGYLQREMDQDGFAFWVNVLNNRDPGNYRGMVCSFITSAEYQQRFSTVVTRTNAECGQ